MKDHVSCMPLRRGMPGSAAAMAALLALLLSACGDGEDEPAAAAAAAAPAPTVMVTPAARENVTRSAGFLGRIEAIDRVDLRARVTGFLEERPFEEGQEVNEGDLLFVIERDPYEAVVAQRQAEVASAEAEVVNTEAQLRRAEQLVKRGNIPEAEVDERRAAYQVARAKVLEGQAALRAAELDLDYTEIYAPVTGKIGRAAYSVGNLVGPDSAVLATIVSQEPMYVTFPVSAALILEVQGDSPTGQIDPSGVVVRLRLPGGSTYRHPGRIDFLSNLVDRGTDTLTARAVVPNPERLLVDGQFVNVRAEDTARAEPALVVPQAAVQYDQAGSYVLVVGADDTVEARRVVLGPQQDTGMVVENGLREGERIIVEGIQKVRPGMQVAASEAEPGGALGGGGGGQRTAPGGDDQQQPAAGAGGAGEPAPSGAGRTN
jgi:membrane fusion protein, multidrug efflux system